MSNIGRFLMGLVAGICFEYVYRVESAVWYLPLAIGVLAVIMFIVSEVKNRK